MEILTSLLNIALPNSYRKFKKLMQEDCINFNSHKPNKELSCAVMRNNVEYSIYNIIAWTEVEREEVLSTILGEENALDEV